MNLKDLAKTPTLIQVSIDDEETIQEFGEPISFYCYDRQPLPTFLRMADNKDKSISGIVDVVKDMILDESGTPIIKDNQTLPGNVLVKVVSKMVEVLGK